MPARRQPTRGIKPYGLQARAHAGRTRDTSTKPHAKQHTVTGVRSYYLRYNHTQSTSLTTHSHRCAFVKLAAQAYASRIPNSAQTQARVRATCGASICKPYAKQRANPGTRSCNLRYKHTQAIDKPNSAQSQVRVRATCSASACRLLATQRTVTGTRSRNLRHKRTRSIGKIMNRPKRAFSEPQASHKLPNALSYHDIVQHLAHKAGLLEGVGIFALILAYAQHRLQRIDLIQLERPLQLAQRFNRA